MEIDANGRNVIDASDDNGGFQRVAGTDGDDLILTSAQAASFVDAGAGDDTIVLQGDDGFQTDFVNTGAGRDTVVLSDDTEFVTFSRGNFDTDEDVIDVSAVSGVNSFDDLAADLRDDLEATNESAGALEIQVGNGPIITFIDPDDAADLSKDNFIFAGGDADQDVAEIVIEDVVEEVEVSEDIEEVEEIAAVEEEVAALEVVEDVEDVAPLEEEDEAPSNLNTDLSVFNNGANVVGTDGNDLIVADDLAVVPRTTSAGFGVDTVVTPTNGSTQIFLGAFDNVNDPNNDPADDDCSVFPDDEDADTVVVNSTGGEVGLFDFNAGDNGDDRIDLSDTGITDFAQLTISQIGGTIETRIEADNLQTIVLREGDGQGIANQFDDLNEDDSIFAGEEDALVG